MKTQPLDQVLKSAAPRPLSFVFDESGGYDCLTSAFLLRSPDGSCVASLDLGSYGQSHCGPYAEAFPKAQATTALLAHSANVLPEVVEALKTVRCFYANAKHLSGDESELLEEVCRALSLATNVPVP